MSMSHEVEEPRIEINGVELSPGQAMTIRAAINSFYAEMRQQDALGTDELGKAIAASYCDRIREIQTLILNGLK